mgnify:CR=1 FL=1
MNIIKRNFAAAPESGNEQTNGPVNLTGPFVCAYCLGGGMG